MSWFMDLLTLNFDKNIKFTIFPNIFLSFLHRGNFSIKSAIPIYSVIQVLKFNFTPSKLGNHTKAKKRNASWLKEISFSSLYLSYRFIYLISLFIFPLSFLLRFRKKICEVKNSKKYECGLTSRWPWRAWTLKAVGVKPPLSAAWRNVRLTESTLEELPWLPSRS